MTLTVEVPDFDGNAMDVVWEENAKYIADVFQNNITVKSNSQGLMSLAKQMIYMAVSDLPVGSHVHYDGFFADHFEGRFELTIEKM